MGVTAVVTPNVGVTAVGMMTFVGVSAVSVKVVTDEPASREENRRYIGRHPEIIKILESTMG